MRVLFITPLFPWAGHVSRTQMTHALLELIKPWKDKGIEISVLRPSPFYRHILTHHSLKPYVNAVDGICVESVPFYKIPKTAIQTYRPITKYMKNRKEEFDVIVAHYYTGLETAFFLRQSCWAQKIIYGVHNTDLIMLKKRQKLLKVVSAYAFRSIPIQKRFKEDFPVVGAEYIANSGIDEALIVTEERKYIEEEVRKELRILTVARLLVLKNIDIVLRALSQLSDQLKWSYTVVGEGPERKRLESLAMKLNISDCVSFTGSKDHKICLDFMDNHDVFIMPSAPETLGLVFLEAMARGMIVIGAKGWGIDGIIQDGRNGFLVEIRDVDDTMNKIASLRDADVVGILHQSRETVSNLTSKKVSMDYLEFVKSV